MTIDEKLDHIINALAKINEARENSLSRDPNLSDAEFDAVEAALMIAAGVCTLFKERSR